jgi:lipopolysaccharide transport system permease protein
MSIGVWLSALNVKYRDIRYTIPFLSQFWLFATPVAYSSSLVPEKWQTVYGINPMVSVVDGFRWALLGTSAPSIPMLIVSVITTVVLLACGLFYFRRMEKSFADIV